ncbi:hypothetical protein J6590_032061 [Homalodisca vitripennis]|nr:hypothetical protein J6590_032061 [Homalodisca vitripennis]
MYEPVCVSADEAMYLDLCPVATYSTSSDTCSHANQPLPSACLIPSTDPRLCSASIYFPLALL